VLFDDKLRLAYAALMVAGWDARFIVSIHKLPSATPLALAQ
jgi:hypothetical protein